MTINKFRTLIDGLSFSECPRWHEGRLYISDFFTGRVLAISIDGTVETIARLPGKPAGIGFLPDGRLLIVSARDQRLVLREHDGALKEHADLSPFVRNELNDMVVDRGGRAWVGSFGFDLMGGTDVDTAPLLCVEPDGRARIAATGLGFPNGMVITPDGGHLIVAESTMNRLSAFPLESGILGKRKTWAHFGAPPTSERLAEIMAQVEVAPDGICLDAEGCVWVADAFHNRLLRVAEGGEILSELQTGSHGAFACMLGGDDGHTLFACVAPSFHETQASSHHLAEIWMTKVDSPHAGLP